MSEGTEQYLKLGIVINETARDLPDGFSVVISIEKHGYGVELVNPNGDILSMGEESMIEDIIEATRLSK